MGGLKFKSLQEVWRGTSTKSGSFTRTSTYLQLLHVLHYEAEFGMKIIRLRKQLAQ